VFLKYKKKSLDESVRKNTSGKYVRLSEGVNHYELKGPKNGQVVVFVPGGFIPMWTWDGQIDALVDAGFRVLRYDHYGRGYSDRPKIKYNRILYRNQLNELLNALQLKTPVSLVGICFGAAVCADFTAFFPRKVKKLFYISPLNNMIKHKTTEGLSVRMTRIPLVGKLFIHMIVLPKTKKRFRSFLEEGKIKNIDYYNSLYKEQYVYKGFAHSVISQFRNDALEDQSESYGKATEAVPTLLVWGDKDTNIFREHIEEIREIIPSAEYHELKDIGHQPNWQIPEKFNALLIEFLKK
jgi:pimeloyl-ACP methyl ester carboxylesterase